MNDNFFEVPEVVEAHYHASLQAMIVRWHKLGPHDHLRPCCEAQLKCVQNQGPKSLVLETSRATGVLSKDDQKWFEEFLFPEFEKVGLERIITVVPADVFSRLASTYWQNTGKQWH